MERVANAAAAETQVAPAPSLAALFFEFLKLGATAFGGPAMVVYVEEAAVTRRQWVDRETFRDGVILAQSIPGAIVMLLSAYIGLKVRGVRGALACYLAFALPAFCLMVLLSASYVRSHSIGRVLAIMAGLQVVVVAIVATAVYKFGGEIIADWRSDLIAACVAVLLLRRTDPLIVILGAALAGILVFRNAGRPPSAKAIRSRGGLKPALLLAAVVAAVVAGVYVASAELGTLSLVMMKVNALAFGGGFTSLALMLHEVVSVHHWMDAHTLMDGIALGQITPGPITMTSSFIGYLLAGVTGAALATAAMYVPCFLLMLAVEPHFDRLKSSPLFARATRGIACCFVGLLIYVLVKFAADVPWDLRRVLLAALAFTALLKKTNTVYVVFAGAAFSLAVL